MEHVVCIRARLFNFGGLPRFLYKGDASGQSSTIVWNVHHTKFEGYHESASSVE